MFERFTEDARHAVDCAQQMARNRGGLHVMVADLIAGLALVEEGIARRVLVTIGYTIDEKTYGTTSKTTLNLPFSESVRQALDRAMREALALGHNYIRTEHLLLGVIGVNAAAFDDIDTPASEVRDLVIRILTHERAGEASKQASPLDLIAAERARQIEVEEYTIIHDDEHDAHELAYAAACYAAPDSHVYVGAVSNQAVRLVDAWPWEDEADKRDPDVRCWLPGPMGQGLPVRPDLREARKRELVKAGALIVAEIERLDRMGGS